MPEIQVDFDSFLVFRFAKVSRKIFDLESLENTDAMSARAKSKCAYEQGFHLKTKGQRS